MQTPSKEETLSFLQAAQEAAKQAETVLLHHFGKLKEIQSKSTAWDLVTEADREAESVIISVLRQFFPYHAILGEESGFHSALQEEYVWAIDPIDGTTNYTHCHPMVATSIGLLVQGRPWIGVIHNPFFRESFFGAKGQGAFLNNAPIHVSKTALLDKSLLASGFAYDRGTAQETNYKEFCHMTQMTQGVRRAGAASLDLAYVAAGRLDGYWERGLQVWDIAAGALLVEEAGGKVSNYEGGPLEIESGRLIATNGCIHNALQIELKRT